MGLFQKPLRGFQKRKTKTPKGLFLKPLWSFLKAPENQQQKTPCPITFCCKKWVICLENSAYFRIRVLVQVIFKTH